MCKNNLCVLLLFLLGMNSVSIAQESKVKVNAEGKDFTSLKHAWSAQWITHPTASTLDYLMIAKKTDNNRVLCV